MSDTGLPQLWNDWLEQLGKVFSEELFKQLFAEMEPVEHVPGEMLRVRLHCAGDISEWQTAYAPMMAMAWIKAGGKPVQIELLAGEPLSTSARSESAPVRVQPLAGVGIVEGSTFDTFVKGKNSEFAFAAATAVANDPHGGSINPLFLYGGVGLGKTHLLHAIGNRVKELHPTLSVRYIAASDFVDEFVSAVHDRRMEEMDRYYRHQVDLLLMDDVQFLQNKVETQNLLFNVFNELYHSQRQIVLTCDRPIAEVPGIHDRLVSRFQWGLSIDIQPPDVETREAILRKKIRVHQIDVPDEVIRLIASQSGSNVRVLESILRTLLFRCTVDKREIDLDMAHDVLRTAPVQERRRVTVDEVLKAVCEFYSVDRSRLLDEARGTKEVSLARQTVMYLTRELAGLSHKSIGQQLGNRDYSTVIHAIKTVHKQMEKDLSFRRDVDTLLSRLRQQ